MKLSTDQARIVSLLASLFPGDLVLTTTKALNEIPDVPEFRSAFLAKIDEGVGALQTFRASVTSPANVSPTPAGATDAAPGSIREKIIAYLGKHPKSAAVAIKEAVGAASGGGFAAALKVGIDKGEIVAHDPETPGGVKTYSLAPAGK